MSSLLKEFIPLEASLLVAPPCSYMSCYSFFVRVRSVVGDGVVLWKLKVMEDDFLDRRCCDLLVYLNCSRFPCGCMLHGYRIDGVVVKTGGGVDLHVQDLGEGTRVNIFLHEVDPRQA